MAKQERSKKSLPQNKAKSYQAAVKQIKPWDTLDPEELRVFDALINSRETETWSEADVEAVTRLARITVEMNTLWAQYKAEGAVIENHRGTPVENPVLRAHNSITQIYKMLRSSLGLTASQRGISGHKQAKRNQQDQQAKRKLASVDNLIAKPK